MSEQTQQQSETRPALYDADARQRWPFRVEHEGAIHTITQVYEPVSDERFKQYERECNRRLVPAQADDDDPARGTFETKSEDATALAGLWDDLCSDIEGMGAPGEQKPEDWKTHIDAADKAAALRQTLLACDIEELPAAKKGAFLPWGYRQSLRQHNLRALFNGVQVVTRHRLRNATQAQTDEFNSLMSSSTPVQGAMVNQGERLLPLRATRLARLYDAMHESHEGYAGRIPLWHKMLVVITHMSAEQEALTKPGNSNGSPTP